MLPGAIRKKKSTLFFFFSHLQKHLLRAFDTTWLPVRVIASLSQDFLCIVWLFPIFFPFPLYQFCLFLRQQPSRHRCIQTEWKSMIEGAGSEMSIIRWNFRNIGFEVQRFYRVNALCSAPLCFVKQLFLCCFISFPFHSFSMSAVNLRKYHLQVSQPLSLVVWLVLKFWWSKRKMIRFCPHRV